MKVVIADTKNGKSYQRELDANQSKPFYGMKIGQEFDGALVGLAGYKVQITGGTDRDGFPMRHDFAGQGRKRILLSDGPGFRSDAKGKRVRKTVRGSIIAADIAQLNTKVKTYGTKKVAELIGAGEKKEEKKEAKPEKKEEKKPEQKKPEEKPKKEEEKPEPKPEEKKEEVKSEKKPEQRPEEKPEEKKEAKPAEKPAPMPEKKEEKKPEPEKKPEQKKEEVKPEKKEEKKPKKG